MSTKAETSGKPLSTGEIAAIVAIGVVVVVAIIGKRICNLRK